MERKLAATISVLFHPLLFPTYMLFLFLYIPGFTVFTYSTEIKFYLAVFVFIMTFGIPASLAFMLKRFKVIDSLQMNSRQERMIPLAMMAGVYFITYYSLSKMGSLALFNLFLLGVAITSLAALAVNLYTKISLHMIGMGGVAGSILGLLLVYPVNMRWLFYLVVLLAGVVGYARLTVTNHTLRQVYNGFMMGFVLMLVFFIL
jgi:hypothetical protein